MHTQLQAGAPVVPDENRMLTGASAGAEWGLKLACRCSPAARKLLQSLSPVRSWACHSHQASASMMPSAADTVRCAAAAEQDADNIAGQPEWKAAERAADLHTLPRIGDDDGGNSGCGRHLVVQRVQLAGAHDGVLGDHRLAAANLEPDTCTVMVR